MAQKTNHCFGAKLCELGPLYNQDLSSICMESPTPFIELDKVIKILICASMHISFSKIYQSLIFLICSWVCIAWQSLLTRSCQKNNKFIIQKNHYKEMLKYLL